MNTFRSASSSSPTILPSRSWDARAALRSSQLLAAFRLSPENRGMRSAILRRHSARVKSGNFATRPRTRAMSAGPDGVAAPRDADDPCWLCVIVAAPTRCASTSRRSRPSAALAPWHGTSSLPSTIVRRPLRARSRWKLGWRHDSPMTRCRGSSDNDWFSLEFPRGTFHLARTRLNSRATSSDGCPRRLDGVRRRC